MQKTVVCSSLLYGCDTWLVRVAQERVLVVFGKGSILWILYIRRRGWSCDAAAAIQIYQFSSGKEGPVGSVTLEDVLSVN